MKISVIVARAHNNVIGRDNDMPWHLPADLKYFKRRTLNHHIIMGRNCFESIGFPLPKRTNIILSRDPYYMVSNCVVAHSISEALSIAFEAGEEEVFIIGGGKIYDQTQDLWDRMYITDIDLETDGDVFFPEIDYTQWHLISEEAHEPDDKNLYPYAFKVYDRKTGS